MLKNISIEDCPLDNSLEINLEGALYNININLVDISDWEEFITMEIWDVLDENGNLTGRTIIRGEELKADEYHLVVHIWIVNSNGDILIQKRPEHLEFAPGVWATTGGSAIQGEDSITAACRETKEELGIEVNIDCMLGPLRHKRKNDFTDIWVVKQDIELENIILQKEEVDDVKWVNAQELKQMIDEGSFFRYSDDYFRLLSKCIQI